MLDGIHGGGMSRVMPHATAQHAGRSSNGQSGEASADARSAGSRDPRQNETGGGATAARALSPGDQDKVSELQERDREVRQHETAHLAAAGAYARSGPKYTYQTGPDGRQYAVGGEVELDTGKEADPRQTIAKAQTVRSAALAPANPSAQDLAVAGEMGQLEMDARRELQQAQKQSAVQPSDGQAPSATAGGVVPPPDGHPSAANGVLPGAYARNGQPSGGRIVSVVG